MAGAGFKFFQFFISETNVLPFPNLETMNKLVPIDLLVLGKTKNPFLYSAVVLRMEQVKVDGLRHRGRKYLHWNRNQSEGNAAMRYRSMGHRKVRAAKNVLEAATPQRPCSTCCATLRLLCRLD
jgi:hypothetical protein